MAIFIASTKSISRSSGQSAVASASYRAGVELEDKRYGKTHDYSKKHGVMSADIILPSALADAKATVDRGDLWNKAEAAEKRKDACVAREWLVNLPYELSEQDQKRAGAPIRPNLSRPLRNPLTACVYHRGFISLEGVLLKTIYSQREAQGQAWLKVANNGEFFRDNYLAHLSLADDEMIIIITYLRIMLLSTATMATEWEVGP